MSKTKTDFQIAWELSTSRDKPFYVDTFRALIRQHDNEELSLSKVVEELNIAAYKWSEDRQSAPVKEGKDITVSFKIEFVDGWENDKRIPESHRWIAHLPHIAAVAAPTKEQAFNEIITSIKVMAAYQSGISLPSNQWQQRLRWVRAAKDNLPVGTKPGRMGNNYGSTYVKNSFIYFNSFGCNAALELKGSYLGEIEWLDENN